MVEQVSLDDLDHRHIEQEISTTVSVLSLTIACSLTVYFRDVHMLPGQGLYDFYGRRLAGSPCDGRFRRMMSTRRWVDCRLELVSRYPQCLQNLNLWQAGRSS